MLIKNNKIIHCFHYGKYNSIDFSILEILKQTKFIIKDQLTFLDLAPIFFLDTISFEEVPSFVSKHVAKS